MEVQLPAAQTSNVVVMIGVVGQAISYLHRGRDAVRRMQMRPQWVQTEAQSASPELLDEFEFFAIIATWMDEDVIEATVRNAFAQGVSRVYIIDNASSDETVSRAESAGAILGQSYTTDFHDQTLKAYLMNALVWRISSETRSSHIWWLWLDADEFPQGPGTKTVGDYLRGLDRKFRVVGANFFNHFPASKPEYISGFHPIEFQRLCEPFWQPPIPRCGAKHWKHPILRFDRDKPLLVADEGTHTCRDASNTRFVEPEVGIYVHHFPYRDEVIIRARMELVFGQGSRSRGLVDVSSGSTSGYRRYRSLDYVYAHEWDLVDNFRLIQGQVGVHLRPWDEWLSDSEPARWYDPCELDRSFEKYVARPQSLDLEQTMVAEP
jgi:hypothetical protein